MESMKDYRKYAELPANLQRMVDRAGELWCDVTLKVEGGRVLYGDMVQGIIDWFLAMDRKGALELEKVDAEELNHGFTFRATSADGTEFRRDCDCHDFEPGSTVGTIIDSDGRVVVVRRKR